MKVDQLEMKRLVREDNGLDQRQAMRNVEQCSADIGGRPASDMHDLMRGQDGLTDAQTGASRDGRGRWNGHLNRVARRHVQPMEPTGGEA